MQELKGKVAVVTGAASGIGFAMANRFASEGMRVVLADIESASLQKAASTIKESGAEVLAEVCDVSKADEVERLATRTVEAFGGVHVLCNNAGVAGNGKPIWEQSLKTWEWLVGVNLWGVIHGCRSFVPIMVRQGEGHVINTASIAGLLPFPFLATYNATKFAVVAISECLFYEFQMTGLPLNVSVLCPGFVATGIADSERNRPAEFRDQRQPDEAEIAVQESIKNLVAAGIPADEVAKRVIDAIREKRFYIFPHPELLDVYRTRSAAILSQTNPPLEMMSLFSKPG